MATTVNFLLLPGGLPNRIYELYASNCRPTTIVILDRDFDPVAPALAMGSRQIRGEFTSLGTDSKAISTRPSSSWQLLRTTILHVCVHWSTTRIPQLFNAPSAIREICRTRSLSRGRNFISSFCSHKPGCRQTSTQIGDCYDMNEYSVYCSEFSAELKSLGSSQSGSIRQA